MAATRRTIAERLAACEDGKRVGATFEQEHTFALDAVKGYPAALRCLNEIHRLRHSLCNADGAAVIDGLVQRFEAGGFDDA